MAKSGHAGRLLAMLLRQGLYAPTILYGRANWRGTGAEDRPLRDRHYHLVGVESGSHRVTFPDGRTLRCGDGGVYLVPPGGAVVRGGRGSWAIGIAFIIRAERLEPGSGLSLRQLPTSVQPPITEVWDCPVPELLDADLARRILPDLRLMAETNWVDMPGFLRANELLRGVLDLIGRRYCPVNVQRSDPGKGLLIRALHAADEHLLAIRRIDDLARLVGVSRRHLTRAFVGTHDGSPGRALRRLRLVAAERLVRDSDQTIAGIAATFRYPSAQAFAKQFRARFGCTPKAYRASHGRG